MDNKFGKIVGFEYIPARIVKCNKDGVETPEATETAKVTVKDLKEAIANLPDDMEVFVPLYERNDEQDIFPVDHIYANLIGVLDDNIYGKVLTFGILTEVSNLNMDDTLCNVQSKCVNQLFPKADETKEEE